MKFDPETGDCGYCQNQRSFPYVDPETGQEERQPCPMCRGFRIMAIEAAERMRDRYHLACQRRDESARDAKQAAFRALRAAHRAIRKWDSEHPPEEKLDKQRSKK